MEKEEDVTLGAARRAASAISPQLAAARLRCSLPHSSPSLPLLPSVGGYLFVPWENRSRTRDFKLHWNLEVGYYGIKGRHCAKQSGVGARGDAESIGNDPSWKNAGCGSPYPPSAASLKEGVLPV